MGDNSIVFIFLGLGIGLFIAFWAKSRIQAQKIKENEDEASRIIKDAERRAESLLKEAKLEAKDRLFK